MKIRSLVLAAAAFGLGAAVWMAPRAIAQQPLWDVVHVNLPYSVTLENKTLPPGDYTIQQLHSENSTVLQVYDGNGAKFETSAMAIKALDPDTARKTAVILHKLGDAYYFDKLWIQGKDYGYEFPLPSAIKSREKEMSSLTVPADVSSTPVNNTNTASNTDTTTPAAAAPPVADTTTTTTPPPPPPPTPDATMTTPATPDPAMTTPTTTPVPEPQATTDAQPTPPPPADMSATNSANREKRPASDDADATPAMPATSAGWLTMLLSGSTLSGFGMMLRRKR